MADETIVLTKNFDAGKMQWPAIFQQKFDGVPAKITRMEDGTVEALSRQGERLLSINHIVQAARPLLLQVGDFIVCECWKPGTPFKDIGGMVRDTKQQHPSLVGVIFDGCAGLGSLADYASRFKTIKDRLAVALDAGKLSQATYPLRMAPSLPVRDEEHAKAVLAGLLKMYPWAEGAMIHSPAKTWSPGKRCWGTQRLKYEPTIDLRVIGFEEATAEDGTPKGMVGRINAELRKADGSIIEIGIGPGKLTHSERRTLWAQQKAGIIQGMNLIAEIKYMPDPAYDALRQPTFQCWRPDKTEPDTYVAH